MTNSAKGRVVADTLKVEFRISTSKMIGFVKSESELLNFTGDTELSLEELRDILSFVVTGVRSDTRSLIHDIIGFRELTVAAKREAERSSMEFVIEEPALPLVKTTKKIKTMSPKTLAICEACGDSYLAYTKRQRVCSKPECREWRATKKAFSRKRRKFKPRISKVCVHCGDKFKAYTHSQYACSKPECQDWRKQQNRKSVNARNRGVDIPLTRAPQIPSISAVCEACGDKFMAYSKYQRVCGKPECRAWRHSAKPNRHYKPRKETAKGGNGATQKASEKSWKPQVTIDAGVGVLKGSALSSDV